MLYRALSTLAIVIGGLVVSTNAHASPWTIPDSDTVLDVAYDFEFATHEFLPDGSYQRFPLDGRFVSNTLRLGVRHGLSDKLELAGTLNFKAVTYLADAVVVEVPEEPTREALQSSILDFNAGEFGVGDVLLTGRYNFLKRALAIANELTVKLPTGYKPPEETFNDETGDIADDVTLGDGQVDLQNALLFGVVAPTRTFARLDVGFRLRFGGAGHQAFGSVKVGQFLGKHVLLFASSDAAYSVTEGEVIGQTVVATSDNLDTDDDLASNIRPVDLRLDKDFVTASGGLLYIPSPGLEVQAVYSRVVIGRNITAVNTFTVSTAVRIPGSRDE